ncbi:glycoside hydrolase family 127 protein, partial [Acidobacteria bacterium AH-259-O06]|nr:glycoside hydrolase family 127 protein [Acidobacteria bacterium AH-259-O06]
MSTRSQSRCKTPGQPFALKSTLQALAAALLVAFNCWGVSSAAQEKGLRQLTFEAFALGSVKPTGWLKNQLEIQNGGLTGNLQKFWADVKESGWIGGNAEGWERAPYWLDGAVPLAFLLDDGELQASVRRYIDYALRGQAQDGWLGPEESSTGNYKYRDPWPVYVMLKVLTQYQEATGDNRVIPAMNRFLKAVNRQLDERPLFSWNRMRWQDGVLSIHWLFVRTKEPWLLDLADKMERQGYNWTWHFRDLPHKEKVEKWEHESHVVNNAMGVKAPAVWYRQSGDDFDRQTAFEALRALDRYHGQATGLFTGDECFAGRMPSQGTELCAVVEYMYSLEWLLQVVGDPSFGDRLERIAFNALPAQIKPDWWARQYVQQANQVVARVSEDRIYTTNGPEANVFGLDTNYGCCTA